jgi:glycosyltransferase 2 family protein
VARVRIFPAFQATAVGFAANNLPGKVGEVLRPALLARSEKLPFSPLLASVALERVFDGASVLFYLLLAVWLEPRRKGSLSLVGLLPAAVLGALVALALFAVFRRSATERLLEKVWRRLPVRVQPRIEAFATTFIDGFASLKSPSLLLAITAGSLGMWLVINLQIYSVLRAFHLGLPFSASFVVTAAAVLGLAVPTPGGLGSYQAAVAETLKKVYGVAGEAAAGVAILAWATSFILITLIGLTLLALSGRERALARAAERMAQESGRGTRDTERG